MAWEIGIKTNLSPAKLACWVWAWQKLTIIVVPLCLKDADGARTCSDQKMLLIVVYRSLHLWHMQTARTNTNSTKEVQRSMKKHLEAYRTSVCRWLSWAVHMHNSFLFPDWLRKGTIETPTRCGSRSSNQPIFQLLYTKKEGWSDHMIWHCNNQW